MASGLQAVVAYLIVALAVAWVVWSVFLPRTLKQRLRGRPHRPQTPVAPTEDTGPGSTPPPD